MPTFGSLFAGIGGIDLGLERAGWTGRWQVEYEPFCQRVLAKHWPDVTRYGDIKDVDWSGVEPVDLIAGGFPCQSSSIAGTRTGNDSAGWLWPEFARAVRDLRPRYVLVENVRNLLAVNAGRAFAEVLGDLAALGYDAEWDCIPASAVGAPHSRDRVWIVAHRPELGGHVADAGSGWRQDDGLRAGRDESRSSGSDYALADDAREWSGRSRQRTFDGGASGRGDDVERPDGCPSLADSEGQPVGSRLRASEPRGIGWGRSGDGGRAHDVPDSIFAGLEGYERGVLALEDYRRHNADPAGSGWWATEPDVGRVAHGVPARVDRLRSLGNAVVPQVVEFIGRRILEAEGLT